MIVMQRIPANHWIVLDTSVVRHTMRRSATLGLDLVALQERRDGRPVSLSSVAMVELFDDLRHGTVSIREWTEMVPQLNKVLDPDFPFIPNGRQLSAMLGLAGDQPTVSDDSRAAWEFLKGVRSKRDVHRPRVITTEGGTRQLEPAQVRKLLIHARDSWQQFFIDATEANGAPIEKHDRAIVREIITDNLGLEPHQDGILAPVVAALAQRMFEHGRGYQPTQNDALDFSHLFMTSLPATICIADNGFINFVAQLGFKDVFVLSPADLISAL